MTHDTKNQPLRPLKRLSPEVAEFLHMLSSLENRKTIETVTNKRV